MTDCDSCENEIPKADFDYYGPNLLVNGMPRCGDCLEEEQHRKIEDYLEERP